MQGLNTLNECLAVEKGDHVLKSFLVKKTKNF